MATTNDKDPVVVDIKEASAMRETSVKPLVSGDVDAQVDTQEVTDGQGKRMEAVLIPDKDYEAAKSEIIAKYPEIEPDLQRSFETPQHGKNHTEGPTMESHLRLILQGFNDLKNGVVHPDVADDPELKAILIRTAQQNFNDFVDYTFLHDIEKPNSMCISLEKSSSEDVDVSRLEITWEQWLQIKAKAEATGQPISFEHEGKERKIKAIGYSHATKGLSGNHGYKGAKLLRGKLGERAPSDNILTAIEMHETAFQSFEQRADVSVYEREYGDRTDEQMNFILTASYIDFLGSHDEGGKPNFKCLKNVFISKKNFELIERFVDSGAKFSDNKINPLKTSQKVLTESDLESIRIKEKSYTVEDVRSVVIPALESSNLTAEQKDELINDIVANPSEWNKKWGKLLIMSYKPVMAALATVGTDGFKLKSEDEAKSERKKIPVEVLLSMPLDGIREAVAGEGERVKRLGKWPGYLTVQNSLVDRVPKNDEDLAPGFDAGTACALDLIPRRKQSLSAVMHGAITPDAIEKIRRQLARNADDPDSDTTWWLAACSVCDEGKSDGRKFKDQLRTFRALMNDPEERLVAAKSKLAKMASTFEIEKYGVPFGTEDGCMLGAYVDGYPVAGMYSSEYGIYFVGSFDTNLRVMLEGFPWKDPNSEGRRGNSGVINDKYIKCADEEEFKAVLDVIKGKVDVSKKVG